VFNVGIGEIAVIVLVCLVVFGPERLPQIARQIGRFLGQLRLTTQGALDQLKEEADLKDVNLPDLRVGSLRSQARDYVRELLDIEGQMADLEREREELKASLEATTQEVAEAQVAAEARVGEASEPAPVDPEAT
jgi:sec-independent protein translocase protein TatB